jgi:Protein of unknown function (DUF1549)/Protein of unknown function (DUF1553)/Planctomycete cytochrome C
MGAIPEAQEDFMRTDGWIGAFCRELGLATMVLFVLVAAPLHAQKAHVTEKEILPLLERKCLQCHGEAVKMGDLDLRTREAMLKGGKKGPSLDPGNAAQSKLYQMVAGQAQPAMPVAPLPPLSRQEIALIKDWIDGGAVWNSAPAAAGAYGESYTEKQITAEERSWWAFQKPVRHAVPQVADARWSANPIDAFIKKALDTKGLTPAPQADRNTLIRRLYLDLVGLLPTPAEVDAFVSDRSPKAYENLVERLLASPHYGERWARHWLDVVRYADSSGFEHDRDLAEAWRYRDYVIKALNQDKPYNRFIVEQLAGDEVDNPDHDSLIATAFYRVGPRVRFREKDNPQYRFDYLDDMVATTFRGFMGMSVNCARCHDHKFDPITHMDYYRTVAMFYGMVNYEHPLVPREQAEKYQKVKGELDAQIRELRGKIAEIEAPYKKAEFEKKLATFPADIQLAVRTPEEQRTPGQKLLAAQVAGIGGGDGPRARLRLNEADTEARQKIQDEILSLEKRMPEAPPVAEGIRDGDFRFTPDSFGDEPLPGKGDRTEYGVVGKFVPEPGDRFEVPPVFFGSNGLLPYEEERKKPVVEPGFLTVLKQGEPPVSVLPKREGYVTSGRRRALAEWIASEDNPLTARVIANRIWYWHFGAGIVPTPGTYGKMGLPPTHPELLDWLATEFMRQGWSIKQMHRLILNSETYKQASSFHLAANVEKDPNDVFLWRFPIRRLEAEIIRDLTLSASGQINLQAGGKPFFPSIPKSVREGYRQGVWELTKEEPATWRRSIYSYWKRGMKYPMFDVHDQPDPNVSSEKRNITTVPTQALTLLNNDFVLLQARHLAERVIREAGNVPSAQVKTMYRIALSRNPTGRELDDNLSFLQKQRGPGAGEEGGEASDVASLTDLADVVLNMNEFVYVN